MTKISNNKETKNSRYVALLRGVNVGGNGIIKMADLKKCFERAGFENVATYIQSGNVLFSAPEEDTGKLSAKIEKLLAKSFALKSRALILTKTELQKIRRQAPRGFGEKPDKYRCDVIFLFPELTAQKAIPAINPKPGVDEVSAGTGGLYFSRLIEKATQSRLSRIVGTPIYQHMTIRNWNTTRKLSEMM